MPRALDPFRFVLVAVGGWMNQHQLQIIDYLREENRVLREQLNGRRVRFNDDQRRRLAVRAKGLGRKLLMEVATIVSPETLLAWHRKLIANKYDGTAQRGPGRPRKAVESRRWWSDWQKRTGIGVIGGSRVHCRIWATRLRAARSLIFCNGTASSRRRSGAGRRPGRKSRYWELIVA